jgi:hypothetical protein
MLSGLLLTSLVVFPLIWPLEYLLLSFRESPLMFVGSVASGLVVMLALFWIYRTLRAPVVLEAQTAAGHRAGVPKSAFVTGSALALALAVLSQLTLKGESAEKAVRLAAEQYGPDYTYFVTGINWAGRHVTARLTAYNESESKMVEVEWEEY